MESRAELTRQWTAAQPAVAAYLSAALRDFHDVQDVLQDVAVAVLTSADRYDASRPFVAWAIGVARNKVFDFRRRHAIDRVAFDTAALDAVAEGLAATVDAGRFDPLKEALEHCLRRVTGESGRLLELRYEQGLRSLEIGRQVGTTPSAVDMALHRIRMALKQCIERRLGGPLAGRNSPAVADQPEADMQELISRYLHGQPSAEETAALAAWVRGDPANAREFAAALFLHQATRDLMHGLAVLDEMGQSPRELDDAWILPGLSGGEAGEEEGAASQPSPAAHGAAVGQARTGRGSPSRSWWIGGGLAAGVILAIAAMVGHFALTPPPRAVPESAVAATLGSTLDAEWAPPNAGLASGQPLPTGNELFLRAGVAEVRFAGGASVVLQGPARVRVRSGSVAELVGGQLAATVPHSDRGFTVETPTARVVDLGTEFGVAVGKDAATRIDVFRGRVEATAVGSVAGDDKGIRSSVPPAGRSTTLAAGEAAVVTPVGVTRDPGGAVPQRFVRAVPTAPKAGDVPIRPTDLDLVDLISGGDGTTGLDGGAIDPTSGASGALPQGGGIPGVGYHRVPRLPVVDGVFIPNGSNVVDSVGRKFTFPRTDGRTFNYIRAEADAARQAAQLTPMLPMRTELSGVDYGRPPHRLLFMHCNKGLTIDLAAVRRLHPGASVVAFRAAAGSTAVRDPKGKAIAPAADLFVLVDGAPRYERRGFTPRDGALAVDVPLGPADRFLTLATTEGADGSMYDHVILGDPRLVLDGR